MTTINHPEVDIVSREQWGAAEPRGKTAFRGRVQRVIIHHTALESCTCLTQCMQELVSIQRYHMNQRGFDDIGYNFLVSVDGRLFEGRGWKTVGAHSKHHNADSVGIAVMGNFNDLQPTQQTLESIKQLLQLGVSRGFLEAEFTLCGHRDVGDTQCPGEHLYAALPQLRRTS
ncbi:peptidoglycan recognition protein 5 [Gouania willdenowi]|uniref:Peptidoglycan-recognition protein SC2-like n=1 Tax=Gouania willdenowi TaxID=441366 RepID=A0A8C5DYL5_GOUWI|nr:peptidoglycan-recognition protein SC2-like [Gouania willdenowi]